MVEKSYMKEVDLTVEQRVESSLRGGLSYIGLICVCAVFVLLPSPETWIAFQVLRILAYLEGWGTSDLAHS